jgi:hypothetical protein
MIAMTTSSSISVNAGRPPRRKPAGSIGGVARPGREMVSGMSVSCFHSVRR